MKRLICAAFLFVTGLVGQTARPLNEVTVQVIDIRNGRVIANEGVNVQFHILGTSQLQRLDGKTGTDGTVKFPLPSPIPSTITVMASTQLYPCYSLFPVETNRLLRDGMLSRCSKPSQAVGAGSAHRFRNPGIKLGNSYSRCGLSLEGKHSGPTCGNRSFSCS